MKLMFDRLVGDIVLRAAVAVALRCGDAKRPNACLFVLVML